jgi:SulP family sulfate permease
VRERVKNKAQAIVLDFHRVPFIDVSASRAVETIGCDAAAANKRVFISGMNDDVRRVLAGLQSDCCLPKDTFFATRREAIRAAVDYVESAHGRDKGKPAETGDGEPSPTHA